jgi:protein ImuA
MPPDPNTLREAIRRLEHAAPRVAGAAVPVSPVPVAPAIDAALPGGGLARGALHELFAADAGATTGFAALLAGRAAGPVLWVAPAMTERPYPPGLASFGLDPALLLVAQPHAPDLLWTVEEALRCRALAAVIFLGAAPGLAAARRLQLAAEAGGTLGLLLRPDVATPPPSTAHTRWRVGALPGGGPAHALAAPRWRLDLLRARGGRPATWHVTVRSAALHPDALAAVA